MRWEVFRQKTTRRAKSWEEEGEEEEKAQDEE